MCFLLSVLTGEILDVQPPYSDQVDAVLLLYGAQFLDPGTMVLFDAAFHVCI